MLQTVDLPANRAFLMRGGLSLSGVCCLHACQVPCYSGSPLVARWRAFLSMFAKQLACGLCPSPGVWRASGNHACRAQSAPVPGAAASEQGRPRASESLLGT